jgi:hypothetical protein
MGLLDQNFERAAVRVNARHLDFESSKTIVPLARRDRRRLTIDNIACSLYRPVQISAH